MYYNKHKYDACIITNKYDISFVKALESIVSQNVQPDWIYIIDDHSKEDIEKSLKLKPSNISFVRNSSTLGRGFCRNLAHSVVPLSDKLWSRVSMAAKSRVNVSISLVPIGGK